MSCFKFLETLITKMESLLVAFFWHQDVGKKIHWLAWRKVCLGKKEGGLGVRSLKEFNIALLCKQAWTIGVDTDSPVQRLFKARYFSTCSFVDADCRGNISYAWRSILAMRPLLQAGIWWQVGDGKSISLAASPWLPMPSIFRLMVPPRTLGV
ncbi:UNVERIFIED_CONTAM: hypothetical protein Sradi_2027800 [Sesamum radiatum]|uniref:Uncharacterized protein n=1 Tax=Sesamum radiatum TaxID=300843 RepID=A0AAW2TFZ2_SESRA